MPEHIHLFIFPKNEVYDVSKIRQRIKKPFSNAAIRYFAKHYPQLIRRVTAVSRTGRSERRFWQAGAGYDRNFFTNKAARNSIAYIHANPVRRKLVEDPTDWPWSSAAWYADLAGTPFDVDRARLDAPHWENE